MQHCEQAQQITILTRKNINVEIVRNHTCSSGSPDGGKTLPRVRMPKSLLKFQLYKHASLVCVKGLNPKSVIRGGVFVLAAED
jgi:hypothetical protein